jgi:hypothetical protein
MADLFSDLDASHDTPGESWKLLTVATIQLSAITWARLEMMVVNWPWRLLRRDEETMTEFSDANRSAFGTHTGGAIPVQHSS